MPFKFDPVTGIRQYYPLTNVTPFTYRDGETYQSLLDKVITKTNETLESQNQLGEDVAEIIDEFDELLTTEVTDRLNNQDERLDTFEQRIDDQDELITTEVTNRLDQQDQTIADGFVTQDQNIDAKFATQDQTIADGFATQDQTIADGFATQDQTIADGFATQDQTIADGFATQDQNIDAKFVTQDENINTRLDAQDTIITTDVTNRLDSQDQTISNLVDETQQWAANTEILQDQAVSSLVSDTNSDTRIMLNSLLGDGQFTGDDGKRYAIITGKISRYQAVNDWEFEYGINVENYTLNITSSGIILPLKPEHQNIVTMFVSSDLPSQTVTTTNLGGENILFALGNNTISGCDIEKPTTEGTWEISNPRGLSPNVLSENPLTLSVPSTMNPYNSEVKFAMKGVMEPGTLFIPTVLDTSTNNRLRVGLNDIENGGLIDETNKIIPKFSIDMKNTDGINPETATGRFTFFMIAELP